MSVGKEILGRYLEGLLTVREDGQEKRELWLCCYAATEFFRMLLPFIPYSYFDKTVGG